MISRPTGAQTTNLLPSALRIALRHRRLLPVIGLGIPDFVPTGLAQPWNSKGQASAAAIANWFDHASEFMLPLYETVAKLSCDCVIALTPDRHLEGILCAGDDRWYPVAGGSSELDDQRRMLLQLAGRMDRPERRVLTAHDWLAIEERNPVPWELAQSHAARLPLLLLGCDFTDDRMREVVRLLRPTPHFRPVGWVLSHQPLHEDARRRCQDLGLEVITGPKEQWLAELRLECALHEIDSLVPQKPPAHLLSPYKHLDYFERQDSPIFFGRETETLRLTNLVCAHQLVILTGPSGTGKTSLLQAGLLAWTDAQPPFVGIYCRCGQDPESSVIAALRGVMQRQPLVRSAEAASDTGDTLGELSQEENGLTSLLAQFIARHGIPIIVLDQAEELFTRFDERLRTRFLIAIRQCLVDPRLPVRVVLSLRDDYLSRLVELRSLLPSLLQNTFYVPPLGRQAGIRAICQPCRFFGIPFPESLACTVLDDIGSQRVAPPQIQIVCDRLFRHAGKEGISPELYDRLGGASEILSDFMDEQLAGLPDHEAALARDILKAMVTSEGTKEVLSSAEIVARSRVPAAEVQRILLLLRDSCRLLRSLSEGEDQRFELAHEYLTSNICKWMSQEEKYRREMEELLIKELRSWRQFRTLRLGPDRLERYIEHQSLLDLDAEALTLLLLSSLTHERSSASWVAMVKRMPDTAQDEIASRLFTYFKDDEFNQRCEAAEVIAQLDPAPLLRALNSPAPGTRHTAIEMLGGIRLAAAVGLLEPCLNDPDPTCQILACGALGNIGGRLADKALKKALHHPSPAIVSAALAALGKHGIPSFAFNFLIQAFHSTNPVLTNAAVKAIAHGRSRDAVEHLLFHAKLSPPAADALWKGLALMPEKAEDWFSGLAEKLSDADLQKHSNIPFSHWLGSRIYTITYRREHKAASSSSEARPWSGKLTLQAIVGALKDDRDQAIETLVASGNAIPPFFTEMLAHHDADIRSAAVRVARLQKTPSGMKQVEQWIMRTGANETAAGVISEICQFAHLKKQWAVLDRLLRTAPPGKARASALRGIIDAPSDMTISDRVLRDCLTRGVPAERYWACVLAGRRSLASLLDLIRPCAGDSAIQDPEVYWPDTSPWPSYDSKIGRSVAEAATFALGKLSPNSHVWLNNADWQRTFKKPVS